MRRQILRAALAAIWCGCGGASTPAPAPVQPTASVSPQASDPQEAPVEPVSFAPATLKVVTTVGHEPVSAHVKVFGDGGSVIAEGKSGQSLAVRSGDLEIEATLSDSKALRGHETVHRSISLKPGIETTETVIFERCLVRVAVHIRKKLDPTAVVTLSKDGATVAQLKSGDKGYVAVAPGRYNASVKSQRAQITTSDVTLNEGATQTIPIDVN